MWTGSSYVAVQSLFPSQLTATALFSVLEADEFSCLCNKATVILFFEHTCAFCCLSVCLSARPCCRSVGFAICSFVCEAL